MLWTLNNNADPAVECRHKQDSQRPDSWHWGLLLTHGEYLKHLFALEVWREYGWRGLRMYNQKGHLLVLWENQESVLTARTHGGSAHWQSLKIPWSIRGNSFNSEAFRKHKPKSTRPGNTDSKVKRSVKPNPGADPNKIFCQIYARDSETITIFCTKHTP